MNPKNQQTAHCELCAGATIFNENDNTMHTDLTETFPVKLYKERGIIHVSVAYAYRRKTIQTIARKNRSQ